LLVLLKGYLFGRHLNHEVLKGDLLGRINPVINQEFVHPVLLLLLRLIFIQSVTVKLLLIDLLEPLIDDTQSLVGGGFR
jgi:hypothetical protein